MKYWKLFIALFIITSIVIANILYDLPGIGPTFNYQTINGEFKYTILENKRNTVEDMENAFQEFKEENKEHRDLKLYRVQRRNFVKFWRWNRYLTNYHFTLYPALPKDHEVYD